MSMNRYRISERIYWQQVNYQNSLCSLSQNQLAHVLTKKRTSSKELLNTLSEEFFHFNRIFTIFCSVTIVALKSICPYKFLCIGLWHFNTSISLKYNSFLFMDNCHWNCSFIIYKNWWTSTQYSTMFYFRFILKHVAGNEFVECWNQETK